MKKAHYDILGVDSNASKKEVIKAYREKSRQFHPDKGGSTEMMSLINEAHDSIIELLDNKHAVEQDRYNEEDNVEEEVNIDSILADTIFEDIDDPEKRISKKYEALHASLIARYRQENDVEHLSGINYFNKFETALYCEVEAEGDHLNFIEYDDLFDLIRKKESSMQECEDIDDIFLQTLTPQIAIAHLVKFIEGKYFGETLKKVQKLFKQKSTKFGDISEYSLYTGILEVITTKEIIPGKESHLLKSLNKVTDFIRSKTANIAAPMPSYLARLLQNLYFRTLFAQAVHLFWLEHSRNFKANDRASLANIGITKKYFQNHAKLVVIQAQNNNLDEDLLRNAAFLKKLYEFEQNALLGANQDNSPDWSRQRGYDALDGLTKLIPFASRNILVNVLIQAGTYFQEASMCSRQSNKYVAKADQKLAFQAYLEANMIAQHSAPDLEIYTLTNTLKFIAAFRYQDDEIRDVINALQARLLNLIDIFPFYADLQSNINLLTHKDDSNLAVMRGLLHALIAMSKSKTTIDHEKVTVLYQAYEACVKNWYQQNYDPELENKFRLELMQLLLESNDWDFSDLDPHLTKTIMIKRNAQGWLKPIKPLRVMDCNLETYSSFDGVEINTKTGEIKFMLDDGCKVAKRINKRNTFVIYDLMEMIEKNIMGANFSLDPIDPNMMYHPFNTMRFAPADIYQTQFLNTMLLADYILKFLTIGEEVQGTYPYDMRPIAKMIKKLPTHLQEIISNFHAAQRHNSGALHRFWIEAEQISEAMQDDDNGVSKLAVTNLKMVVKKHTMERDVHGNLVDTQKDDEGWDLYVLTPRQKLELDTGRKVIKGPAMVFVPDFGKVFFIETDHIFKEEALSRTHLQEVEKLSFYKWENNGKVIITLDNSMFIYRLINGIAAVSEVQSHFSPEYVFAQEFTAHYNEFSEHFLIFARLKELSKMTLAIRFLNEKQAEATDKKDYFLRLLHSIPDWEQRDTHPSKYSNYFAKPIISAKLSKDEEEQVMFRNKHAEKIRPLLPHNLYKEHLQKVTSLFAEPINTMRVTINSPEIEKICNDSYWHNKDIITQEHGEDSWNHNKSNIWQQICGKKAEFVLEINTAREKNMREQLRMVFGPPLDALPAARMNSLIENAMCGDLAGFAEELAKKELREAKKQIKQVLIEQDRMLDALKQIGLGCEESKDFDLQGKCLWVPASVKHHIAGNQSLFIYGGVRVLPKVNVISNTDPRHRQVINQTFNNQAKVAATNNQLNEAHNRAQAMRASRGGASASSSAARTAKAPYEKSIEGKAKGLNSQGYQEHHIISNKNSTTRNIVTEAFNRAGMGLNDRANKMFLPKAEGIHPTRSIHLGRHDVVVNKSLEARLSKVIEHGNSKGWTQNRFRQEVMGVIQREKALLRTGERTLNKNKTTNARPASPPLEAI